MPKETVIITVGNHNLKLPGTPGHMDQFFRYDFLDEVACFEADLPANQSAFVSYAEQPSSRSFAGSGTRNVNKRMVELLIRRSKVPAVGTTSDKNTIMQIAAEKIRELQSSEEELRKQNSELEAILAARRDEEVVEGAKIRFRVGNPSSGIDSMLSVLKCLKETASETRAIQSSFSAQELSAVIEVQNKSM
ncbi:hypothetical protein RJ639_013517 [Escallonia herrerae]|uniref:BHLH domain-containing protein n=1 Tax=Escallonia herrerae TaxID=1293975 RepID=A0AA88VI50_9ASTE|nr:hypothetical protein RJ639_013517 [Escallonia herrerae]